MKQARRFAKEVKRRVTRILGRQAQVWPDVHRTALLAGFAAADGDGIRDAALAYFTKTLSSAGFLTAEELPQAVADYTERNPAWIRALLAEAEEQLRVGLPVYASRIGPLDKGLDWPNLPTDKYGDPLYQLRPHRFGFAPRLAMAAYCGADTLPTLLAILDGWIAQVDARRVNHAYFSNLVIIYRLLAISWALPFCVAMGRNGDNTAAAICVRLYQILAADTGYLWPLLGDSAPNNHLLADRFAAWFLAICYPDLCPRSNLEELEQSWQSELCKQFYPDGTSFEQSVHYHELGCEMALAYIVISLRAGRQLPEPMTVRIRKMYRFQAALADDGGNSFALGDATEDPLLPLDAGAGSAGGAWRVLYRSLFDASFPDTSSDARGAERAYWPLAALSRIVKPLRTAEPPLPVGSFAVFPDGGYAVFQDESPRQRILFRIGPRPGLAVHFGHAMSDLLSVYWTVDGQEVLEPSGTFSYAALTKAGSSSPRNYFRSAAASNGIVLEGHDPLGMPTGRFRGSDNGTRVTPCWRSLENLMSWTEGRLQEDGPLNGHRRGVLHIFGYYTLVYDRLPTLPPERVISSHWQLAPEIKALTADGRSALIPLARAPGYICVAAGSATMTRAQEQMNPMAGWISRSYGEMQPAPQLIANVMPSTGVLGYLFGLATGSDGAPSVEVRCIGEGGILMDIRRGDYRGIACIGSVSVAEGILPFDFDFRGAALWLRIERDALCEIRALALESLQSRALRLHLSPNASSDVFHLLTEESDGSALSGQWKRSSDL